MNTRTLDASWALLLLFTCVTWWLGESGSAGPKAVMAMLAIAAVKGALVISEFMALRRVRMIWPLAVGGWLLLVLGLILGTYWKGL